MRERLRLSMPERRQRTRQLHRHRMIWDHWNSWPAHRRLLLALPLRWTHLPREQ